LKAGALTPDALSFGRSHEGGAADMKQTVVTFVVSLILAVLTLLAIEGAVSIANWKRADRSLVYGIYSSLRVASGSEVASQPGFPVATRDDIERLIPDMVASGVGMGNVPYKELVTDRAAINAIGADGCRAPKPSIRKYTTYIRSGDFDRFDPPSLFYDRDANLNSDLQGFIDTYGVRKVEFTSNASDERLTIPQVEAPVKILVAGDSVAVGSMIGDAETIASQLQRRNASVQYVNLGVNGAAAEDIVCRLTKAADRYKGEITELIYVYSENDFDPDRNYGRPEDVIAWLHDFVKQQQIPRVTVVFAPYIYNIVPHITRFAGSRGADHGLYAEEVARLEQEVKAAGFSYLSIADLAFAEAKRKGTDFAVLAMFVDHAHLSDYGTTLLVDALASQ
jgi:hypothetical protein